MERVLEDEKGPFVAVSDSMRLVPDQIARWVPGGLFSLGTDGFGRSDSRQDLRRFFGTDAAHVVVAVLGELCRRGEVKQTLVKKAIEELSVDPDAGFSLFL